MRKMLIAVAALAATGGPAMAALGPEGAWLKLATVTTVDHIIFDGAVWRCRADACFSPRVKALPPLRSCRRLVRQLGAVTAFHYRGEALEDGDLAACNTTAKAD